MNKKFLSAILFGALMVSSTGTFVSCKDYDDDIDQINNTLNDLKSQIAALQTEVSNGQNGDTRFETAGQAMRQKDIYRWSRRSTWFTSDNTKRNSDGTRPLHPSRCPWPDGNAGYLPARRSCPALWRYSHTGEPG